MFFKKNFNKFLASVGVSSINTLRALEPLNSVDSTGGVKMHRQFTASSQGEEEFSAEEIEEFGQAFRVSLYFLIKIYFLDV